MHQLRFTQTLPIDIETAWRFFSDPSKLKEITPADMGFIITSEMPEKMYAGLIVSYIVSPVLRIPMTWVTEITHVKHLEYFVDEQRLGPYQIWHHEHHFKEVEGGVEMIDILSYRVPFGFIGKIANFLFVKSKILDIFSFRERKLNNFFK